MQTQNLLIFNPGHDLALANMDANYMPPAAARLLASDLALLPVWYGRKSDMVLAASAYNKAFLDNLAGLFPSLPSLITPAQIAGENYLIQPWGWDPALNKGLLSAGLSAELLPSAERLSRIRENSNRRLAVEILGKLAPGTHLCGESYYITDKESVKHFVESNPVSLLKAPLSGSGKGLNWCKGEFTFHIERWVDNTLTQQGGVVAEPFYDKVADLAMLFYTDAEGKVSFAGYSVFETNKSGAYEGNILATDAMLEDMIVRYVPRDILLYQVRENLIRLLNVRFKGVHEGYFGVDMMICRFPDSPVYRLHPCVEINLRMTMGMVTRLLYDNHIQKESTGHYRINYYPSPKALLETHTRLAAEYPLKVSNGRVVEGYMSLVPVTPGSRYGVSVNIERKK